MTTHGQVWRDAFAESIGTASADYDLSLLSFDELRMLHALMRKARSQPLSDEDVSLLALVPCERVGC